MAKLRMRDYLTLRVRGAENKKFVFECKDSASETGHSLLVTVEATHAGLVNGNMRFYRPDRMQDGCHTWTSRYPRPVLLRYNDDSDPIGRVAKAHYKDFSWEYASRFPRLRNLIFYDSGKKRLNLFDSVDYVVPRIRRRSRKSSGMSILPYRWASPPTRLSARSAIPTGLSMTAASTGRGGSMTASWRF